MKSSERRLAASRPRCSRSWPRSATRGDSLALEACNSCISAHLVNGRAGGNHHAVGISVQLQPLPPKWRSRRSYKKQNAAVLVELIQLSRRSRNAKTVGIVIELLP